MLFCPPPKHTFFLPSSKKNSWPPTKFLFVFWPHSREYLFGPPQKISFLNPPLFFGVTPTEWWPHFLTSSSQLEIKFSLVPFRKCRNGEVYNHTAAICTALWYFFKTFLRIQKHYRSKKLNGVKNYLYRKFGKFLVFKNAFFKNSLCLCHETLRGLQFITCHTFSFTQNHK